VHDFTTPKLLIHSGFLINPCGTDARRTKSTSESALASLTYKCNAKNFRPAFCPFSYFVFDFSHNFFSVGFIYHQLVNVLAFLNMLKMSMMKTIMQVAW
jgi:hypothetical protein